MIHSKSLDMANGRGVLEAGVARAGAHQGVFASKGKVAPLTVDICNIHTHTR